jgi:hypothetical protein
LQTNSTGLRAFDHRKKLMMLAALSLQSIHSNPWCSKSTSCAAGSLR